MIPLTVALRDAGHQITVATSSEISSALREASLRWAPAGLHPRDAGVRFPGENPAYGPSVLRSKVDDLLGLITSENSDVVIREATDLAAAIAAEVAGLPCITFGISSMIPRSRWRVHAGESLDRLRLDYRLAPDPDLDFLFSSLYIDVTPPELESPTAAEVSYIRYVRYEAWDGASAAIAPAWLEDLDDKPTVLATLGTVYNNQSHVTRMFFSALESMDVNVVYTLGNGQSTDGIGPIPANVRVVEYLPHSLLLPRSAALLCHGGFNTVLSALCEGVPMVCVPLASDQFFNASRCEQLGCGIQLVDQGSAPVTADMVRHAIGRVLTEERFREGAQAMRAKIEAQAPISSLVPEIEQLCRQ